MAYNPQNPNGQATMANSAPVVIASNQSSVPMIQYPVGSGGVSVSASTSLSAGATQIPISLTPAQVYGWYFYNPNGYVAYVHFYDLATVIVGTSDPKYCLPIPPAGGANVFGIGIPHSNSIKIHISTTRKGTVALPLGIEYNIFYKQ